MACLFLSTLTCVWCAHFVGHTYISELYLNQDHFGRSEGFGWTANMVFNYSQGCGVTNRGRLSGTALVTLDEAGSSTWHAPLGGTVAQKAQGQITVAGISLGTAAVEEWVITLDASSVDWSVSRIIGHTASAAPPTRPLHRVRGSLHEGRSTRAAPRGCTPHGCAPYGGVADVLFYTDVRSILMVL